MRLRLPFRRRPFPTVLLFALAALLIAPERAFAQPSRSARDTVVRASLEYDASAFQRWLVGDAYRDLWATPIRVPILDLASYDGGLKPLRLGGGGQTRSLHLMGGDGREFVFRPVAKVLLVLDKRYRHTVVWDVFADQFSAMHPTAPLVAGPLLEAVGVLHATPTLVVMPNDPLLGDFRTLFGGVLGTIEEMPHVPAEAPGFAGAREIIDSEELLARLNKDPSERVDTRAFLAARLIDMLLNDNDRHPGQWSWAKIASEASWRPVPRDRDKALISYKGFLLRLVRRVDARQVSFERTYPGLTGLFYNALEFDRRLLVALDKPVWDSVASAVARTITDSVILEAARQLPPEYAKVTADIVDKLKVRRDRLPNVADRYYRTLFTVADIHATDAADRARVSRSTDGSFVVNLETAPGTTYLARRFEARDTREVRLYLHGGSDQAIVRGEGQGGPMLRIIGGNGTNVLIDSSRTSGGPRLTRLYDAGRVQRWSYTPDTVKGQSYAPDTAWNRRPWQLAYGQRVPPVKDRGTAVKPLVGFVVGQNLGFAPQVGVSRVRYAFRTAPYSDSTSLVVGYSSLTSGVRAAFAMDRRIESSRRHYQLDALASQLEQIDFHGFGNDVPTAFARFDDLRQTQFVLQPALGYALGPRSNVSLGPVAKYVMTSDVSGHFIAQHRPYGAGHFGEAGAILDFRYDTRDVMRNPHSGIFATARVSAFPAVWSVTSSFAKLSAMAASYLTLPVASRPVLAFRAGAEKLLGEFPYYEAAAIGGVPTVRGFAYREYLGDASLFGTTEMRVPLAQFPLILPLDLGLIGFFDVGRVFLDSASPSGWHTATGGGFWLGVLGPSTSVTVLMTDRRRNRFVLGLGYAF